MEKQFKEGDYVVTYNKDYMSYGKVMKIKSVDKNCRIWLYGDTPKYRGSWAINSTFPASIDEIIDSKHKLDVDFHDKLWDSLSVGDTFINSQGNHTRIRKLGVDVIYLRTSNGTEYIISKRDFINRYVIDQMYHSLSRRHLSSNTNNNLNTIKNETNHTIKTDTGSERFKGCFTSSCHGQITSSKRLVGHGIDYQFTRAKIRSSKIKSGGFKFT